MKVLNYTGLKNLWTNIKNYITVHTPTKTSDLTNDSGFLTSTDISSKANDSEVLHKAQTETVTGEKTFKKDVKIIDLNANERPGVKFEVNGSFRTFEDAKDALPDTDSGDFGVGTLWSGWVLDDNTKIQNSMSDYVINDITFGTTNYSSVIELNNYYKVKYGEADNIQTDLRGMLRFELSPYAGVQKDSFGWSNPKLYFYAMLDNDEFGETILGHEDAHWSKAYINEINCYEIKFGGMFSIFDVLQNIQKLSYVTHYSSTALTPSSTNSNTLLDNTDNLKVGDKVIDSSGVLFSVTAIDTANSTFTIGTALIDLHSSTNVGAVALPIGSYIQFAGSQPPDGFLVCNGGEISRITYSALFAVIGTTYGSGDGSTTFNLPDLTNRFLQGSTSVGTVKDAGLPNITGDLNIDWYASTYPTNATTDNEAMSGAFYQKAFKGLDGGKQHQGNSSGNYNNFGFDASRSSSIYGNSNTVQPPALTCLICIKY